MSDHDPIETGWRIHAALIDWTGKVDSKAAFALTIESAMFAGVIAFDLADLQTKPATWLFWAGVTILSLSLLLVAYVVRPQLRRVDIDLEYRDNFIYFGHLRKWRPTELARALQTKEILPMLSKQLVAMSTIAWRKHRLLQHSLTGAVVSAAMFALAAWLN